MVVLPASAGACELHLLCPSHTKPTLRLEEGLAVHFSRRVMARLAPDFDTRATAAETYLSSVDDYDAAYALRPDFIRAARTEVPDLGDFTPDLLLRIVPGLEPALAEALCRPFGNTGVKEPVGDPH